MESQTEDDVFCERVISELDKVLKNPDVCSFEIIQVPFKQNKSPIQFIEHHLGVESWCIKFVYQYAHRLIINQRKQSRIPPSIVKYLNCVILINPDVSTFWNLRRILVERVQLNITQEFQFSSLVLTKKPKSSEAFFYRRWLYSFQSVEAIDWAVEISLTERCAERKAGNYHAWNHRQWVLQKAPNLLMFELTKTEKFMKKNIADYSCFHHRHFVLMRLFDQQYYDLYNPESTDDIMKLIDIYSQSHDTKVTLKDLIAFLLPYCKNNLNEHKLKSFLFCLNCLAHDIILLKELKEMYGNYETFACYKRVIIKFAVDIIEQANKTDYLSIGLNMKPNYLMESTESRTMGLPFATLLMNILDTSSDDKFKTLFFNNQ